MEPAARPDDALPEGPFLRAATRLMLLSLMTMVLALLCLYLAPIKVAPFVSAGLYALLFAMERRHGVTSPITSVMLGFYAPLAVSRFITDDIAWSAYAGPAVYGVLALMVFGLLAIGRPFTAVYSRGAGLPALHQRMSVMWGSLHLAAALAGYFLMPSLAFLYVPMALMLIGATATLVMNFVWMGPGFGRQKRFELGRFRFEQVETEAAREDFYTVIAEAYRGDLARAAGPSRRIDAARIKAEHLASDAKRGAGAAIPFLVRDGAKPVGGICLFLDHPELGLPIEAEAGISLDVRRATGALVEMGRLGILPTYRLERKVLTGLFKCVIETAIERRVSWVMNDSFTFQVGLYSKIGFQPIQDEPYVCAEEGSTGYGLKALPMTLDLERMIRLDQRTTTTSEVQDILQPFVVERFFKLLAVRELFRRPKPLLQDPPATARNWSKAHAAR